MMIDSKFAACENLVGALTGVSRDLAVRLRTPAERIYVYRYVGRWSVRAPFFCSNVMGLRAWYTNHISYGPCNTKSTILLRRRGNGNSVWGGLWARRSRLWSGRVLGILACIWPWMGMRLQEKALFYKLDGLVTLFARGRQVAQWHSVVWRTFSSSL